MRLITSQARVSNNRERAGSYRSFMVIAILIGLLINLIFIGLILYLPNQDGQDAGQSIKFKEISKNYSNNYQGVLGLLRLARSSGDSDGMQPPCNKLYIEGQDMDRTVPGQDLELTGRDLQLLDGF